MPLALSPVRRLEPVSDVVGDVADLSLQVGLRETLLLGSRDKAAGQFGHILRCADSPILLDSVNAILDPEIDKLAGPAHRI